jgi:MFS family permease
VIVVLSRALVDPLPVTRAEPFDTLGAVLSAAGLVLVVMGVLAADDNAALMVTLLIVGTALIGVFFVHIRSRERAGREPLLSTAVFRNRIANLGLVTQNVQWLLLMGTAFVVSAYLQVVRGYNAIQTGVIFTAATGGILISSLAAQRLAKRHSQRTLIIAGFITTIAGIGMLLALVAWTPSPWAFAPGLLLIGLGVGVMLTPSVNVVQSVFPEDLQGEISGLSRCISNLGSSLGTAVAGTILVAGLDKGSYAAAMITLAVIGFVGLGATLLVPSKTRRSASQPS